tara:strand:- start:987 stop:1307 length:321 start_codon:yes stop_codon:yes gene_type:complete
MNYGEEMKNLLETILRSIIVDTESISIEVDEGAHFISFRVGVADDETGKVIGRGGSTATSIRTLLKCAAAKHRADKKVMLDIIENPEYRRRDRADHRGGSWNNRKY